MIAVIVTFASIVMLVVALLFLRRSRLRRLSDELSRSVVVGGAVAPAADFVWSFAATGVQPWHWTLPRQGTALQMAEALDVAWSGLGDEEHRDIQQQVFDRELRVAERDYLYSALQQASAAPLLVTDAVLLGLADQHAAVDSAFESAVDWTGSVAGGDLLSGVLSHGRFGSLEPIVPDTVQDMAGDAFDSVVDGVPDIAGGALEAVDAAGLPMFTLARAAWKAQQANAAGVEGGRVAENLAADVILQGGGIAGGAALGTLILPGFGTVVGGLIGGIFGSMSTTEVKGRHLRAAQERLLEALGDVATSVGASAWTHLVKEYESDWRQHVDAVARLEVERRRGRRWHGFWPDARDVLFAQSIALGNTTVDRIAGEVDELKEILTTTSDGDWASQRGMVLVANPWLADKVGLSESDLALAQRALDEATRRSAKSASTVKADVRATRLPEHSCASKAAHG